MSAHKTEEQALFLAAVELPSPAERSAYLRGACGGNEELRASVEALLASHERSENILDAPPVAVTLASTGEYKPLTEGPGTVIGPYKLLQQIGEGGFGTVFMAEQETPIRRKVALKIIKPGMDTAQVIARFESERQALALMDHPNIAKVFEAGATASGRPYFVMELVKGVPITEFCDKNHLPPETRLKLFIDVCHAIQHAHHKRIIHRDIKPSNVMVTLHDGVPVVKVIDFGVAKATLQKLTEKTLFTAYGQMIGTPAYMSPEQAEMSGLDIDTRSDVYSLGVLLYELLTGTTPLESKRLREAGYAEMQRLIREEEPPRPSTRLSSLGDSATIMAGNRGLDVKKLAQLLAGDLDWVVMKALEKDRNRRYDTPASFTEDIQRYLQREAILARPPSRAYKARKFIQRNRAAVLMACAFLGLLLAATVVSALFAFAAIRAEEAATKEAHAALQAQEAEIEQRQTAETLRTLAEERRVQAEANERKAVAAAAAEKKAKEMIAAQEAETKAVLEFVENKIFAAARPAGQDGGLGPAVTLRRAVEAALPFVEKSFAQQPLIEARLRTTLGISYWYLGEAKQAAEQFLIARTIFTKMLGPDHPHTLSATNNLATSYAALGRQAEALRLREETLALRRAQLGTDHPETLRSMSNLAMSYTHLGRHAEALKLREETVARQRAKLGPDHPDTLTSMSELATNYADVHRYAEALKLREETLALQRAKLGPNHPETLWSMNNLACSYADVGRHLDALKLREETLALQKTMLGTDHPETLRSMNNLANTYAVLGRQAEALKLREETLTVRRLKFGVDHPDTLRSMSNLALSYMDMGRYAEALKLDEETLTLRKARLGPDHPDTLLSMVGVAEDLSKLERSAEALPIIDECIQRSAGKTVNLNILKQLISLRSKHVIKTKDVAGCRQTAEMWEKLNRTDVDSFYTAARLRAMTATVVQATPGTDTNQRDKEEADRAMDWLRKAIAAGYKNVDYIKKDKNLDILRPREDFKKLLADMEAGGTKEKK